MTNTRTGEDVEPTTYQSVIATFPRLAQQVEVTTITIVPPLHIVLANAWVFPDGPMDGEQAKVWQGSANRGANAMNRGPHRAPMPRAA